MKFGRAVNKETQAAPWSTYAFDGFEGKSPGVAYVRGAWNSEYMAELEKFPSQAHDDQVDATSHAWRELERYVYGTVVGQQTSSLLAAARASR